MVSTSRPVSLRRTSTLPCSIYSSGSARICTLTSEPVLIRYSVTCSPNPPDLTFSSIVTISLCCSVRWSSISVSSGFTNLALTSEQWYPASFNCFLTSSASPNICPTKITAISRSSYSISLFPYTTGLLNSGQASHALPLGYLMATGPSYAIPNLIISANSHLCFGDSTTILGIVLK